MTTADHALLALREENEQLRRASDILQIEHLSSERNSTAGAQSSRLHRHPPRACLRWVAPWGRADLRAPRHRPLHIVRCEDSAACCERNAWHHPCSPARGTVGPQLLGLWAKEALAGGTECRARRRPRSGCPAHGRTGHEGIESGEARSSKVYSDEADR